MQVALTLVSKNVKTGPIPTSMTTADSCPNACPLAGKNGCYAEIGHVAIHWRKVTNGERGTDWQTFVKAIAKLYRGTLWRHNVAGDLPGDKVKLDSEKLNSLVKANKGKRGFTYTHYNPKLGNNGELIASANSQGFTVNLSANSLAHADELADANVGPIVTLLPSSVNGNIKLKTPMGRTVSVCPATYRDDVTCQSCGLCAVANRKSIVGFPAHGISKRKADAIAMAKATATA